MPKGVTAGRWGKPLKDKPQERNRVKKTETARSGVSRQRSEKLQRRKCWAVGIAQPKTSVFEKGRIAIETLKGAKPQERSDVGKTRYGVPQRVVKHADDEFYSDTL